MKKRILVYSVDAMVCEDVDALRRLPNFQKFLAGGCEVTGGMRTIYPSVTYPAHVSMMTGCYVGKHGVTSNFSRRQKKPGIPQALSPGLLPLGTRMWIG